METEERTELLEKIADQIKECVASILEDMMREYTTNDCIYDYAEEILQDIEQKGDQTK